VERTSFLSDVLEGLSRPRKELPCKYFYDERGSRLFERICELDEYYLTRVELGILRNDAAEMAKAIGPDAIVVEFGSGAGIKTEILLDSLDRPFCYVPVDISGEQLKVVAATVSARYPSLRVVPLNLDFTQAFDLSPELDVGDRTVVVYFPGSTIGNFMPGQAVQLMIQMRRICGSQGSALIGFDLHKPTDILHAAYNDSQGVTAAFNLNLLQRINCELAGTFEVAAFRHVAQYDTNLHRIEMFLESTRQQSVSVSGEPFEFEEGERVRTEYCHKYTVDEFNELALAAGLVASHCWTDDLDYFAIGKFDAT